MKEILKQKSIYSSVYEILTNGELEKFSNKYVINNKNVVGVFINVLKLESGKQPFQCVYQEKDAKQYQGVGLCFVNINKKVRRHKRANELNEYIHKQMLNHLQSYSIAVLSQDFSDEVIKNNLSSFHITWSDIGLNNIIQMLRHSQMLSVINKYPSLSYYKSELMQHLLWPVSSHYCSITDIQEYFDIANSFTDKQCYEFLRAVVQGLGVRYITDNKLDKTFISLSESLSSFYQQKLISIPMFNEVINYVYPSTYVFYNFSNTELDATSNLIIECGSTYVQSMSDVTIFMKPYTKPHITKYIWEQTRLTQPFPTLWSDAEMLDITMEPPYVEDTVYKNWTSTVNKHYDEIINKGGTLIYNIIS